MSADFLIGIAGWAAGLTEQQTQQIEASMPAMAKLIAIINQLEPIAQQAVPLFTKAAPLINEALAEWKTVGPSALIIADALNKK
jgi:hypothetical protein